MEQKSRIAQIYKVSYCIVDEVVQYIDIPDKGIIISAKWKDIEFSTIEFIESSSDDTKGITQELHIGIAGNNTQTQQLITILTGSYCLIKLTYSNSDERVVGTPLSPILLTIESEGNPIIQKISCETQSNKRASQILKL